MDGFVVFRGCDSDICRGGAACLPGETKWAGRLTAGFRTRIHLTIRDRRDTGRFKAVRLDLLPLLGLVLCCPRSGGEELREARPGRARHRRLVIDLTLPPSSYHHLSDCDY